VAAGGLIVLLVFESLADIRGIARWRAAFSEEPAGGASPRLLPRSLRLLAGVVVVLGLAGGVALLTVQESEPLPAKAYADVNQVRIAENVTRGEYLEKRGVPTSGFSSRERARVGFVIEWKIDLSWPANELLQLQQSLHDSRTLRRLGVSNDISIRPTDAPRTGGRAAFDFRACPTSRIGYQTRRRGGRPARVSPMVVLECVARATGPVLRQAHASRTRQ